MFSGYDTIDRIVTVTMQPQGDKRGRKSVLYELARGENPISYEAARALNEIRGAKVGIMFGAAVPVHMPKGENDGPLGAVVLADTLNRLGYEVSLLCERELFDVTEALLRAYGLKPRVIELARGDPEMHAGTALDLDALVCIEKAGVNSAGVLHSAHGDTRDGTRAKVDGLVRRMNADGKLTIAFGDNGNEIGFGAIYDQCLPVVQWARECRCPCGKGILAVTPVQYLFPCTVSNWGAYALSAALALTNGSLSLAHTAQRHLEILEVATAAGAIDGGTGLARPWEDGVPPESCAAVVQLMWDTARLHLEPPRKRAF